MEKDCYIQHTTSLRLTPTDQHKFYNGECSGPYRAALDVLFVNHLCPLKFLELQSRHDFLTGASASIISVRFVL